MNTTQNYWKGFENDAKKSMAEKLMEFTVAKPTVIQEAVCNGLLSIPTYLRHIENKQGRTLLTRYAIRHASQEHTIPFSPRKQPKEGAG